MFTPTPNAQTAPGMPTPAGAPPQGIQQLMPGQAQAGALNSVLAGQPQQPAEPQGAVASMVKPLSMLDPMSLQRELLNPNSQYPKYAVLSALDQKNKQRRAAQAVQNQLAMQQAAGQQGTVKDMVMTEAAPAQPPVQMRAHGGPVQHFSNGADEDGVRYVSNRQGDRMVDPEIAPVSIWDAISNIFGGGEQPAPVVQDAASVESFGQDIDALKQRLLQAKEALYSYGSVQRQRDPEGFKRAKAEYDALANAFDTARRSYGASAAAAFSKPDQRAKMLAPAPQSTGIVNQRPTMPNDPRLITVQRPDGGSASASASETRKTVTPSAGIPRPDMFGDIRNSMLASRGYNAANAALLRQGAEPTEEEKKQRGIISGLRAKQLEAAQKDVTDAEAEAAAKLEKARNRPGIFSDPESLAALAGAISTRKGELMGSAGRGLSSILNERRRAMAEAEKEFGASKKEVRQMQSLNRQLEIANQEKEMAILTGDRNALQNANLKIAELNAQQAKFEAQTGLGMAQVAESARGHDIQLQVARIAAAARQGDDKAADLLNAINRDPELQAFKKMLESGLTQSQRDSALAGIRERMRILEKAHGVPSTVGEGPASVTVPKGVMVEQIG
jgi:hypothetical protein